LENSANCREVCCDCYSQGQGSAGRREAGIGEGKAVRPGDQPGCADHSGSRSLDGEADPADVGPGADREAADRRFFRSTSQTARPSSFAFTRSAVAAALVSPSSSASFCAASISANKSSKVGRVGIAPKMRSSVRSLRERRLISSVPLSHQRPPRAVPVRGSRQRPAEPRPLGRPWRARARC
jgi:hypothetical protein